ncbi:MAG: helix-turn-helix domain-containing protein [Ruminococcaceae bacterium]|nr:helix-turn-helix domain-containing protein [Oscillospiraceae bacterium]
MPTLKYSTEKDFSCYINVNSCGQQWLSGSDYDTNRRKGRVDFSLYYIEKGSCYFEFDGVHTFVPEGSLLLYPPRVPQHYYFKKEQDTKLKWSHFIGSSTSLLGDIPQNTPTIISLKNLKHFNSAFDKMIEAFYNVPVFGNDLTNGYMLVLLALIKQNTEYQKTPKSTSGDDGLNEVLSLMYAYFDHPIDIAKYANICHLSEDRFIRLFKSKTGMPPYRYQLKIRIDRAIEMLENRSVSVAECAEIVGFDDPAYFSRIFKKFTGHPPSYYKK